MKIRRVLAAVLLALFLAACEPLGGGWVVRDIGYHGPRGKGTDYVLCVREGDEDEPWRGREVNVSPEVADSLSTGDRCPG